MRGDLPRVFEGAAVLQIGGNFGRAKSMIGFPERTILEHHWRDHDDAWYHRRHRDDARAAGAADSFASGHCPPVGKLLAYRRSFSIMISAVQQARIPALDPNCVRVTTDRQYDARGTFQRRAAVLAAVVLTEWNVLCCRFPPNWNRSWVRCV